MGFFSKKSITVNNLATSLADMVLQSNWLASFSHLLSEMGEEPTITPDQKKEIIAVEMLTTVYAIQKGLSNNLGRTDVLDAFHMSVYTRISKYPYERKKFEEFLNARYEAYYKILNAKGENMMLHFGKQFSDFFRNRDTKDTDLILNVSIVKMVGDTMEIRERFLKEVLAKFELIK